MPSVDVSLPTYETEAVNIRDPKLSEASAYYYKEIKCIITTQIS
jgi:hypothetical protein